MNIPKFYVFIFLLLALPTLKAVAQINKMNKTIYKMQVQQNPKIKTIAAAQNSITYRGMITIPPDIYSKMRQEGQTAINSIPGNPVKVQLWRVVYQADPRKNGYTEILLQQLINPSNFSYRVVSGGITYQIDAAPSGNNLAIVVFSNKLNSVPSLALKGRPNDATTQADFRHYESNAKKDLGQNVVYGIYSITPGKTDMSHLDFTFFAPSTSAGQNTMGLDIGGIVSDIGNEVGQIAKKAINGVEYIFDQTVDGVSGLAKFVINGAEDATGFFIDQAGQIFYEVGGTIINLIAFGNLPKERSLTQAEYDWANKRIFNGTLPDIGRIKVFNFMNPDHHRMYTWPSPNGNFIYMNIGDAFDNPTEYVDNINYAYPVPGQVYIHELTHAWQIGRLGFTGMMQKYIGSGGLSQSYDPGCGSSNINSNFNLEQQATLVDRTFMQLYFQKSDNNSCTTFEQQWVENNIRNGIKFDLLKIKATIAMQQHAKLFSSFIGNVNYADANYSAGNGRDGDGYFMLGPIPWSVLYYTTKDGNTYANWGEIRKKYNSVNAEHGYLGWPSSDIINIRKGSAQKFQRGWVYNTQQYGTFIVEGLILDTWANKLAENGELGYPISDFIPDNVSGNNSNKLFHQINRGGYQKFEHGMIKWSGIPGAQAEVVLTNTLINNKNNKVIH